jgi:hypothetical protein
MTPKDQKAVDWQDAAPCKNHGFQKETNIIIDEVVGELKIPIVSCHSDEHPTPKKRGVMLVPVGKDKKTGEQLFVYRIHDHMVIKRRHGLQTVNDFWTLKRCGLDRVKVWATRQLGALKGKALVAFLKILAKLR